jgi:hypothetical protein
VIQLVFSILLGAGLFALLYLLWMRERARPEGGAEALLNAQNALSTLKGGLLPGVFVARIFAEDDLHFVTSTGSTEVQKAFAKERKRLALLWVSQVRGQIVSLRKFHLGKSRYYARLNFATELSLAASFSVLLAECRVLHAMIYLRGPYAFPRFVGRTITAASRVCGVSERSIAFLSISNPKMSGNGGAENQAAS